MSREHAKTYSGFCPEEKVRMIVQEELEDFFSAIKTQIERKIKAIDKNIIDVKISVSQISSQKQSDLNEIYERLQDVERMLEEVRKNQKEEIQKITENIRSKSFEKDKTHIFRKTNNAPSLDSILFGEQNHDQANINHKGAQKGKSPPKAKPKPPPLPKNKFSKTTEPLLNFYEQKQTQMQRTKTISNHSQKNQSSLTSHDNENEEDMQDPPPANRIIQSLNKNKNSFMRKKSLKKFNTIPEEEIEESILSDGTVR